MRNDNYEIRLNKDELFPTSWYENVTNATNYVLEKINIPEERVDDVIKHILDYNINKQIRNKLLDCATDNLPEYLSLVDTPSTKILNDFKDILDACDICPSFKEHVLYIQMSDCVKDKKHILFWKKLAEKDFKNLSIKAREIKSQECMKLTIRKK